MKIGVLSKWGAMAAFVAATFTLSANVASMTGESESAAEEKADAGFVVDKPGEQARHIEVLERLHRGW